MALKTLREDAGDDQAVDRFRREARLARSVAHRNVCRVFEVDETTTPAGAVMPEPSSSTWACWWQTEPEDFSAPLK